MFLIFLININKFQKGVLKVKFLNNFKLRGKIFLNLSIAFLGIIIISGLCIKNIYSVANLYELTLYKEGLKGQNLILNADRDMYQALVAKREALLAAPASENFKTYMKDFEDNVSQAYERSKGTIDIAEKNRQHWEKFNHKDADINIFDSYDKFKSDFDGWVKSSKEVLESVNNSSKTFTPEEIMLMDPQFSTAREHVNIIGELFEQNADFSISSNQKNLKVFLTLLIALIILITVIVIIFGLYIAASISKPISLVVQRCEAMSENDYSEKLDSSLASRKDEVGLLSNSINIMTDSFNALIGNISTSSNRVSSASTELASGMKNVAEGAVTQTDNTEELGISVEQLKLRMETVMDNVRTQAAAIQETSSSLEEVSQTINIVTKNSGHVLKVAAETSVNAKSGAEMVNQTLYRIKKIEELVKNVENKATALGDKSEEIGNIISVIDEIAGQTNLLALNAAIEAAHAGDVGKGFAVVADEIKDLAERSRDATKEIEKLIRTIQEEVKSVIKASKDGYNEVMEGTKLSALSATKISEIIIQTENTRKEIENVSNSMEEQYLAVEEITKAISSVAEGSSNVEMLSIEQLSTIKEVVVQLTSIVNIAQKTTAETEEALSASDELADIASELSDIVNSIKIASSSDGSSSKKLREYK